MRQLINRQVFIKKINDSYKPLFCSSGFYKINQIHFSQLMPKIDTFLTNEKFIVWVLFLSLLRRPTDWYSGKNVISNIEAVPKISSLHKLTLGALIEDTPILTNRKVSVQMTLADFLTHVKIKALPESIYWSMQLLLRQPELIVFTQTPPSAVELLKLQCTGKRVITFDTNLIRWPDFIYDHRDILSFWIHDLVHVAEFFKNDHLKDLQISIYRWIDILLFDKVIEQKKRSDEFNKKFEYLISDMNSHPLHLVKTFRAICDIEDDRLWNYVCLHLRDKLDLMDCVLEPGLRSISLVNSHSFDSSSYAALLQLITEIGALWGKNRAN